MPPRPCRRVGARLRALACRRRRGNSRVAPDAAAAATYCAAAGCRPRSLLLAPARSQFGGDIADDHTDLTADGSFLLAFGFAVAVAEQDFDRTHRRRLGGSFAARKADEP